MPENYTTTMFNVEEPTPEFKNFVMTLQTGPFTNTLYEDTLVTFFERAWHCPVVPADASLGQKIAATIEHSEVRRDIANSQDVDLVDVILYSENYQPRDEKTAAYHSLAKGLAFQAVMRFIDYKANKPMFDHQPDRHIYFNALRDAALVWDDDEAETITAATSQRALNR